MIEDRILIYDLSYLSSDRDGATARLEGSGTGQGGHLRRYIKSMSASEFLVIGSTAALFLFFRVQILSPCQPLKTAPLSESF